MSDQEKEQGMKVDEIWPEYYENKAREKKEKRRAEFYSRLIALGIVGYMFYLLYYGYEGSAQDLMSDILIFIGLCCLCYGAWYGVAWLSRFFEDREHNKVE